MKHQAGSSKGLHWRQSQNGVISVVGEGNESGLNSFSLLEVAPNWHILTSLTSFLYPCISVTRWLRLFQDIEPNWYEENIVGSWELGCLLINTHCAQYNIIYYSRWNCNRKWVTFIKPSWQNPFGNHNSSRETQLRLSKRRLVSSFCPRHEEFYERFSNEGWFTWQ